MSAGDAGDLSELSVPGLLQLSREILRELRARGGVIRSSNAPAGELAEFLVQRVTQGDLARGSQKSWDVVTPEKTRLQVKARVLTSENPSRQLSPIRTWEFDELVVVLFDDSFAVSRAVFLPAAVAKEASCGGNIGC